MAEVMDETERNGNKWELKMDSRGRPYAVAEGHGRVPVKLYKAAKHNEPLEKYV